MKRSGLLIGLFVLVLTACAPAEERAPAIPSDYDEADIATLQQAMEDGSLTAAGLVDYYLERIAAIDHAGPELRSIIEINPEARSIAEALDAERAEGNTRGPLHGIPVVLKANIDTGDEMATHAGSLAIADHHAPDDASIAQQLRAAGAVILAKANLSEWANFRSTRSSSGWSSIGGQTKNPYEPLRNPCGSSSGSGVAVAANLTVLAVGTETNGSIICPAGINGVVGIKPTLGLVSRDGIIPIAHSQDTAGPMARTVRDAALMLNAMSAPDDSDPFSEDRPESIPDFAADLATDALQGKRIGVLKNYYGAGENPDIEKVFRNAVETLKAQGAEIVDDIEIETEGMSGASYAVLLYEFKADLNAYLASSNAELETLAEIIEFNTANADTVMPIFGQEIMEMAEEKGPLTDQDYLDALEKSKRIARDGIDNALKEHDLDALVAPTNGPSWMTDHVNGDHFSISSSSLAAISGYASITVPAGHVSGLPAGLSFIGGPFTEKSLIEMAYAFEQASKARRAPGL
ncbi:MAG: amidase [Acidobacteria bacterium]|nr:amidase [Acidobacteriota bacterium]NIM62500.1 amidase [Acidobacteriota bacterium]NIO60571.1 amidase [Acidobacteriota bacterium]NIQ29306.1 amidase [Acidobacteriota bacterium]NIQ83906.1 amidase [Acidobacteriota bacterium]